MPLNRRTLLSLSVLPAIPAFTGSAEVPAKGVRFEHGVASGDPLTDRVILWTRISGVDKPVDVVWQVARDDTFSDIVAQGRVTADAGRDYTVKADAASLMPGTAYSYRFIAKDVTSPVGRTHTLPETTDDVVLAVVSCSLHSNGYFNAYRHIAGLDRVDAVVHLGDYIYEYGAGPEDYGMGNGRTLGRTPEPPYEIVSLTDYRTRHAQYKRDDDLQAAHARAPWICVFDDHEICNNPWVGGDENHNPEKGEGRWWDRKAAALKAYREWMPIRDPAPKQLSETIYRSFRFGQIAELIMLETRLLARSKQLDYGTDLKIIDGKPDYAGFAHALNDPGRQLLGPRQTQWLGETLTTSVRDGVRWQVLGNQVLMAKNPGPDIVRVLGEQRVDEVLSVLPADARAKVQAMIGLFSGGNAMPFNLDAWDGYPAERERFYELIKASGARVVVTSGDSHTAWANELHDAKGQRVAVELGVTSVTSPTKFLDAWLPDLHLARTLAEQNPEVIAADDSYNGYVRLTLTKDEMSGEWMSVDTITSKTFACVSQKRFIAYPVEAGVSALTVSG